MSVRHFYSLFLIKASYLQLKFLIYVKININILETSHITATNQVDNIFYSQPFGITLAGLFLGCNPRWHIMK